MMNNASGRARMIVRPALMAAFALAAGCMSLETMAPPVNPRMMELSAALSSSEQTIARGRELYLSSCIKCHNVVPIGDHSVQEWSEILPKMNRKARLNDNDGDAVHAYVLAAHRFLQLPEGERKTALRPPSSQP